MEAAMEATQAAFAITYLSDHVRLLETAEWEHQMPACSSFRALAEELHKVRAPSGLLRQANYWHYVKARGL